MTPIPMKPGPPGNRETVAPRPVPEMTVLVTGGTGFLGREVVDVAARTGYRIRIGSRRPEPEEAETPHQWARMDVATGEGVTAAFAGVDCVIHAATDPKRAGSVDVDGTRLVVAAASAAGVKHLVHVSIVGIDRIPLRYYRAKLLAEEIVADGAVPYSILRATQFHTLVDMLLAAAASIPIVMPVPTDFRVQSVAPIEVAGRLVRAIADGPGGRLRDFGGPEAMTVGEAVRQWRDVRAERKRVMHLSVPGRVAGALRAGMNTAPEGELGTLRWHDWLIRTGAEKRLQGR